MEKVTSSGKITMYFTYDQRDELQSVTESNKEYYYIKDITGNIIKIKDEEGNSIVEYKYDAYGKVEKTIIENNNVSKYNPFIYKGYYYDEETELYYCNTRYYSPELGRFLQVSDVSELNPHSINGLNLYAYANNNPISYSYNNVSKKNLADSKEKLIRLEQDLKTFEPYKDKEDFVICSMINGLANDMMWTMYIGNNKLGEYLFAVNRVYYETIKYCFENHYRFLDLYGTSGDPNTTYKNLGGLHKYKERFGDTYIEFIGEFDLVNKKVLYKVLPILLKIYRKSYYFAFSTNFLMKLAFS